MKAIKRIIPVLALALMPVSLWADALKYKGTISDKYAIEMELNNVNDKVFTGRYRYQGKDQWLSLKGDLGGPTQSLLVLKEFAPDGKNTGAFNLAFEGESLVGDWQNVPPTKSLKVKLMLWETVAPKATQAVSPTGVLSGKYSLEVSIDTSSFPKEHAKETPVGDLVIRQDAGGNLEFQLSYNSGYPQYHIGEAQGVAKAVGNGKYISSAPSENIPEQKCIVELTVEPKGIRLNADSGAACGFGAMAEPGGLYRKK